MFTRRAFLARLAAFAVPAWPVRRPTPRTALARRWPTGPATTTGRRSNALVFTVTR